MKFIHTADLHFDSKMEALPKERNKTRREEIIRSFERLCDYAEENGVVAVIISGDMFDSSKVSAKTKRRILYAFEKHPSVTFLYLKGNHDESFGADEAAMPENLKTFEESWKKYSFGNVDVYGVNFNGNNADYIYDGLNPEADKINIVALHGQVVGYKTKEGGVNISLPRLKNKNIDYLALGHIHSFSEDKLDDRGIFAYCGCLEGRGFDETGDKGFVLIETENKKVSAEFVKWSTRNYCEYEFDLSSFDNFYSAQDQLIKRLKQTYSADSVIKVVLKGEVKEDFDISSDYALERLNEEFFFVKIKNETKLKIEEADFRFDKSVRGEFVRQVLASDIDEEKKNKIISTGLKVLKGEDI